ncbi:bifunctional 2-C-methyl-D-erythritol 4-phosphate cytidylyltransferase/2-C-methyl-D-erythritol 2,4-cyclodiphosphate synthase [Parasulfitobacter algicola]|uniref:Bifunctional enzyme IspD/IspF n=1 Tax=Parasulfitobacter algicola TaxID=2614809 RepID=A0ABX2IQT0_9RHOB|nr:bifunctional 2-C-methyl-D-erythritol 4-phosphate cytidylyltransferase/2-C-methyl-D-erythritol 2,4-cyclodiphosphate synthase [Sulfitobacter algicola]NSX55232.1 bifunctional 2-C-methyl-D-erythritol 4-phosphate cytidylyltransferase/2-C-methyl-D-erythritol 2,4-cyclodiphosphate synthase [Sulfitobacter algicola]
MTTAAVIVAAGRGTRAGGEIAKQWQTVAGRRVADWTLDAFRQITEIEHIVVVLHPDDLGRMPDVPCVIGGATRCSSVLAGLQALSGLGVTKVLIHDVARPCISAKLIQQTIDTLDHAQAAAPALVVTDALWRGENDYVTGTQDRAHLYRAQTPQGFDYKAILKAHQAHDGTAADDVEVARAAGIKVAILPGSDDNLKITQASDFARAEKILGSKMDIRLGNGFDVHRFGAGDHVTLCGISVPFDRGLQGHSDADVGMHAVTDAIYGALAQGDIGQHFPPSDPQWKGAASDIFLRHAVDLAAEHGFQIANVDCTLICEQPKIGPHTAQMKDAMAHIIGITANRVSIKATTSERLGFTGREEGIAALATATLIKP